MIATAGADRLQEGMRRAFGKPTGRAARMVSGQSILIIYVPEDGVETARKACETAGTKMPIRTRIIVEEAPPEPESHAAVEEIPESPPSQMIEEEAVEEVAPTISAKA
jgi:ribosomal protein L16/L10AE